MFSRYIHYSRHIHIKLRNNNHVSQTMLQIVQRVCRQLFQHGDKIYEHINDNKMYFSMYVVTQILPFIINSLKLISKSDWSHYVVDKILLNTLHLKLTSTLGCEA